MNYSDSLEEATNQVKALSGTYTQVSESLNGLKDASEMGNVGAAMQQMSTNLGSLNEMYAGQLKQLR